MEKFRGIIIEEALDSNVLINQFEVCKVVITNHQNPSDRWHMYEVNTTIDQINLLKNHIVDDWYVHFWKDGKIIALFHEQSFVFDYYDKATWAAVLQYGTSIGIPPEQLDFPITGL